MPKEKGIIHIPAVLFLVGVLVLSLTLITSLKQSSSYDQSKAVKGTLIAKGDNGDSSGSSGSTPKPESKTKTVTPEGVRVETKDKEDKQKTEIRFGEGEKIKTRVEEGRARIDVYSGGVKVRYEFRDGQLAVKVENEEGEELELEPEEIEEIEDDIEEELEDDGIKIATAGGKLAVIKNRFGASTNFPLSINPATNELIVTTSAGQKTVTILPDQAVQNMLAANVISRLGARAIVDAALQNQVASASAIVELGVRNNIPVYEIPGIRDFRLLGFIPVSAPVTAVVSAETGGLLATEQSLFTRIIDFLSP